MPGMNDAPLQQLIDAVRAAAADRRPLRLHGGGTKAFLGHATEGEPLSTRSWRGIVSHEPTELVVTVRAGTPLAELEATLAETGQSLPFEPPHFGADATVGGMVAAGLSGPARASVGSVRDHLLGVQCLNGRGEALTFGGQVMKNVAGYDVSRVLAGSWGTLALITEVSLKVLPKAPAEATLVFALGRHDALEHLHRWGGQPLPLNASSWMRDENAPGAPERLHLRLRGALAAVDAACARLAREAGGRRLDPDEARAHWHGCREQQLPFFRPPAPDHALWRLSVPQTAPDMGLPYATCIEWHGAQRWVWAPTAAAESLRAAAALVGGHTTLWRPAADGSPHTLRFDPLPPPPETITRRLRSAFDPAGLFNPGRMG